MAPVPKVLLNNNETRSVTFTMRRLGDDYYCTCHTWKISAGRIKGRSCSHLKELLGEEYEEWRLGETTVKGKKRKAVQAEDEGDDETGEEDNNEKKDTVVKKRVVAKGKGKAKVEVVVSKAKKVVITAPRKKAKLSEDEKREKGDDDIEAEEEGQLGGEEEGEQEKGGEKEEEEGEGEEEEGEDKEPPKRNHTAQSTTTTSRPARAATTAAAVDLSQFTSNPLLAHKWEPDGATSINGWHCSEKLDGVRAIWTGTKFISRDGNTFYAPDWFTKRLPKDIVLDGELFTKRGGFQDCVSIVRTQDAPNRWKFSVSYQVFDVPSKGHLPFEKRLEFLKDLIEVKLRIKWVNLVKHQRVRDDAHVQELLDEITSEGAEGLMLREPKSPYVHGRSRTLLKAKKFMDADAIVRGYNQGSGKNSNVVGALMCEMLDPKTKKGTGKMFKVGSGLTDAQRKNPPKIGATIIYKYQELSKNGNPRFPTYVGERAD